MAGCLRGATTDSLVSMGQIPLITVKSRTDNCKQSPTLVFAKKIIFVSRSVYTQ